MSSKLIILVEDDLNLRQSIALILQRAGYHVTATGGVYEAMDLLQSGTYQLIISDINVPETKKVLIPKVLSNYPDLSIVILTDQTIIDPEKEVRLLSAHYLVKPVAPEHLIESISILLGKAKLSDHSEHNGFSGGQS